MPENLVYEGRDLEAMSFARNYHQWILDTFKPYLGKRLVEVGAGTGSFSELLLNLRYETLSLVEPSRDMFRILVERLQRMNVPVGVSHYNSMFVNTAAHIKKTEEPDSIIYVNVLEHIPDDLAELRVVQATLQKGGRVFIFVPAFQWLYGGFDRDIGHFRRYTKKDLETKCRNAGFKTLKLIYFDVLGVAPWWLRYRVLKSNTLSPNVVQLYDRYIVPAARKLESMILPPIGKNILLIGEKL